MDVIGSTALYVRVHERLLYGYAMDALSFRGDPPAVDPTEAQGYLDWVRSAKRVDSPTAGDGRYAVLQGEVVGGELTWEERLVHLSAFPMRGGDESREHPLFSGTPIVPPSRRRRRR
jgi:hypothetical protein